MDVPTGDCALPAVGEWCELLLEGAELGASVPSNEDIDMPVPGRDTDPNPGNSRPDEKGGGGGGLRCAE
jgi:hypothetical protein